MTTRARHAVAEGANARLGGVAPPVGKAGAPVPYRVQIGRFANGLRVRTIETPYLHTATVALYVKTGSRHESPRDNGLSHFVEHMLFRGCRAYPTSFALNSAVEELGGTLHAETGRDYSLFSISLSPTAVPKALAILGELFSAPLFGEIESERRMIMEEILEDLDDRGRNVNVTDRARARAFAGHPLALTILGPAANVRRFSVRDVRRHFRRCYGARNMILCVGGPVAHHRVMAQAESCFRAVPPGHALAARPFRPSPRGPVIHRCATDASQTHVNMLFHAISAADPDAVALSALMRLIDDGMATPLHYRVCDQKGLAYSVAADHENYFDTSLVEVDAACAPEKLDALVAEILDILAGFRLQAPSGETLDRARRRHREDLESSYDDVAGLCGWFGGAELFSRPRTHAERLRQMDRVTPAHVMRVAQRIFRRDRLTVVLAGSVNESQARRVGRRFDQF